MSENLSGETAKCVELSDELWARLLEAIPGVLGEEFRHQFDYSPDKLLNT